MKIFCIGDSLCLPRLGVAYEDTWIYKLKRKYKSHDFICSFERASTSWDLFNKEESFYSPDYIIVQLGICDCAPRYINEKKKCVKFIIKAFSRMKCDALFWKFVKRMFKRTPNCVWVSIDDFRSNIFSYINKIKDSSVRKIVFIKICTPGKSAQTSSPFLLQNIIKYNTVFDEAKQMFSSLVEVINPLAFEDDMYYVDGYHTNGQGFDLVYKALDDILQHTV